MLRLRHRADHAPAERFLECLLGDTRLPLQRLPLPRLVYHDGLTCIDARFEVQLPWEDTLPDPGTAFVWPVIVGLGDTDVQTIRRGTYPRWGLGHDRPYPPTVRVGDTDLCYRELQLGVVDGVGWAQIVAECRLG